jgi:hypothetical protein
MWTHAVVCANLHPPLQQTQTHTHTHKHMPVPRLRIMHLTLNNTSLLPSSFSCVWMWILKLCNLHHCFAHSLVGHQKINQLQSRFTFKLRMQTCTYTCPECIQDGRGRDTASLFQNVGTRRRWMVSLMHLPP